MAGPRGPGGRRRPHLLLAGLWLALLGTLAGCAEHEVDAAALAAREVPEEHVRGEALYEQYCQSCHGAQATGTDAAPPLAHPVYRPRHHGDEAFQLAVRQGVRAHHFRFGDMPPVPGPDRDDVVAITGYVRWLQRAAGIE